MAQTIAAHAGFAARLRGEEPAIGFLLGTRLYSSLVVEFPAGTKLDYQRRAGKRRRWLRVVQVPIETNWIVATAVVNTYVLSAAELASPARANECSVMRSVLVTGASKGIGAAIAVRLAHGRIAIAITVASDRDGARGRPPRSSAPVARAGSCNSMLPIAPRA